MVVLSVATPLGAFLVSMFALYFHLVRRFDAFDVLLLFATTAIVIMSVVAAMSGMAIALCLVILMLAPLVTVVGYEVVGYRRATAALAE